MHNKLPTISLKVLLLIMLFNACSKDTSGFDVGLAYKLIADKTWYLDYAETTTGSNISTRTYLGQPTYFINYLKSLATTDSDGLVGVYSIQKDNQNLKIQVSAKTNSGNASSYNYTIESIGANNMILSYVNNNIKTRLFFSILK
jgi:hypothetical protein